MLTACGAWLALSAVYGGGERWLRLGNWAAMLSLAFALTSLGDATSRVIAGRTALLVTVGTLVWLFASWALAARGMHLHAGQGNPNWAGMVLAVAWPLAFGDRIVRERRWATALLAAAVASGLALTESRVAWVASGVAWLVVIALGNSRRERLLAGLQLVVLLVSVAVHERPAQRAMVRHEARAVEAAPRSVELDRSAPTSLRGRIWIARNAGRAALDVLPLGAGLGNFYPRFLEAQGRALQRLAPAEASRRFSNATTAHNDWIELAVEAGPLAPLLLLLAFALALRASVRSRALEFAAALLVAAICALGDSPLHLPAVSVLLALGFGALPASERALPASERAPSKGWKALAVASLLFAGFLLSRSVADWLAARFATAAFAADSPRERLRSCERAARLAPDSAERVLELGLARRDNGDTRGALVALERASQLGGGVASAIALGAAALDAEQPGRAHAAFERALSWSPGSARAHTGLSEALRRLGSLEQAERHAVLAAELLPGNSDLRARIDAIREQRMDRELDLSPP